MAFWYYSKNPVLIIKSPEKNVGSNLCRITPYRQVMDIDIELKPFKMEDWEYLQKWIKNERELIQFAGPVFSFPVDRRQVKSYISEPERTTFKIDIDNKIRYGSV